MCTTAQLEPRPGIGVGVVQTEVEVAGAKTDPVPKQIKASRLVDVVTSSSIRYGFGPSLLISKIMLQSFAFEEGTTVRMKFTCEM